MEYAIICFQHGSDIGYRNRLFIPPFIYVWCVVGIDIILWETSHFSKKNWCTSPIVHESIRQSYRVICLFLFFSLYLCVCTLSSLWEKFIRMGNEMQVHLHTCASASSWFRVLKKTCAHFWEPYGILIITFNPLWIIPTETTESEWSFRWIIMHDLCTILFMPSNK